MEIGLTLFDEVAFSGDTTPLDIVAQQRQQSENVLSRLFECWLGCSVGGLAHRSLIKLRNRILYIGKDSRAAARYSDTTAAIQIVLSRSCLLCLLEEEIFNRLCIACCTLLEAVHVHSWQI